MKKQLFIAIHSHRHGLTLYPVLSAHLPSQEEIIKLWDVDFEPDRDETIDIEEVGEPKTL